MRSVTVAAILAVLLTVGTTASAWTGSYADLTSRAEYEASTDIPLYGLTYYTGLGGDNPGAEGGIGYRLTDFQMNLLYQAIGSQSISDTRQAIEDLDDWRYAPLGNYNFPDGENYFLRIDTEGGLDIGNWGSLDGTQEYQSDSGESWVQWTISGWWDNSSHTMAEFHTILAGSIDGDFLEVIGGYRAFEGEVNPVEVFEGHQLLTEVGGYTLDLDDQMLYVTLTPEPATMSLLALGGVVALARRRRQR